VKPIATVLTSTAWRTAGGRVSASSIRASARLTKAIVSGPVPVLPMIPTTVKVWVTKSAGASFGLRGRSIVLPTPFLNSLAMLVPSTTSPRAPFARSRPWLTDIFSALRAAASGDWYTIISGAPKLGVPPGAASRT
jgi:hypothetical protein